MIQFSSATLNIKSLVLTSGSYSIYTCVTVVASTTSTQNYDLSTLEGTTSYEVPAFTLNPPDPLRTIVYTDVVPVAGVTFDSSSRTYDWTYIKIPGSYSITIQGSVAGSTSVITSSFTVKISMTTVEASTPMD